MYIAICGSPGAGKTTLQEILHEEFNIVPVDDGRILRDVAKRAFGLSEDDVVLYKDRKVDVLGKTWEVREILGKLGNALEEEFGEFFVPHYTIQQVCPDYQAEHFSFGSVRRSQPLYFKEIGGLVIEVVRDNKQSHHYFDEYDQTVTDLVITNNGTLEEFRTQVIKTFTPLWEKFNGSIRSNHSPTQRRN